MEHGDRSKERLVITYHWSEIASLANWKLYTNVFFGTAEIG
jgi:hypothetical protein